MTSLRFVSCTVLPAALCLALAGTASARPRPDTDGNITAYDYAGKSVLIVVECQRGSLGPEYPKCLERVRTEAYDHVCRPGVGKEIAGKTHYKYRMGAIKTLLSDSLACGAGGGGGAGAGGDDSGSGDGGGGDSDERVHDRKGSCGAYELDGTVIVERRCLLRSGGKVYDYVSCGQRVRDRAKELICRDKGKGMHKYMYRSGETKPSQSSVFCKN
ncbi:MAG TPA: hypothetical protein VK698_10450 [Kofleriaceae bacterium]|nr:hypothetical protein [Kofleriaceae bacterium]